MFPTSASCDGAETAPPRPSASLTLLLPSKPFVPRSTPTPPSPPAMLSEHCQSGDKHPINWGTCLLQKLSQKKKGKKKKGPGRRHYRRYGAACSGNCQFKGASKFALGTSYGGAVTAEHTSAPIPLCGSIIGLRYLRGCCRWAVKGGATAECNSCTRWNPPPPLAPPGWRRLASSTPSSACSASPVGAWHVLCRERERERSGEIIIEGVAGSPCCVCWNVSRLAFGVGRHDLRL